MQRGKNHMADWHNPQLLPCFSFAHSFTYKKLNLLLFFIVFGFFLLLIYAAVWVLLLFCFCICYFLPLCILQFVKLDQHSKHKRMYVCLCVAYVIACSHAIIVVANACFDAHKSTAVVHSTTSCVYPHKYVRRSSANVRIKLWIHCLQLKGGIK